MYGRQCYLTSTLETELRTKADSQVVMHSVVEEDIIANFSSNSDWSGKGFNTTSGIECKER